VAGEVALKSEAMAAYNDLFNGLMWVGIIAGIVLLAISPILNKYTRGIK